MTDKDVEVTEPSELSEAQSTELQEVLKELPMDLVKNLPTIVSRLNAFLTFYSTLNLKRLSKLTNYMVKAEEVLFDEDNLLNQDNDSIKENYKQAKTAALEILDLARKVAVQIPQEDNKDVDEVSKLLKSLSPEALAELKDYLQSKDGNENK
jgi:hypothetical protein